MRLYSTNQKSPEVSFKEAVFKGLPNDNGLFMPFELPTMPTEFIEKLENYSFPELSFEITRALIGDEIDSKSLREICDDAISFDAPVVSVHDNIYSLELFHGPTLAFKDFGARFMSRIMSYFLKEESKRINILVATSGDTGSAVAQGFFQVPGIEVTILYPKGKVSKIQEQQLTTNGFNIKALEIDGTFDDCQRMVKTAFLDKELNERLNLSSANSINISRLIPQSFYYWNAYRQLSESKKEIVFCTPSGNFGNLCGGLIAKKMGLPVRCFVAATNINKIVPDYLLTSKFEPKPSIATLSNAMDVGNPSNFPRVLALHNNDYEETKSSITGTYYSDKQTLETMSDVHKRAGYMLCPHSAVGYMGIRDYLKTEEKDVNGIFLSTAHPSKFMDTTKKATGVDVEIPDRLQDIVNREKEAIEMSNDFEELKAYLMA